MYVPNKPAASAVPLTTNAFESLWEGSLIVYQVVAGSNPVGGANLERENLKSEI